MKRNLGTWKVVKVFRSINQLEQRIHFSFWNSFNIAFIQDSTCGALRETDATLSQCMHSAYIRTIGKECCHCHCHCHWLLATIDATFLSPTHPPTRSIDLILLLRWCMTWHRRCSRSSDLYTRHGTWYTRRNVLPIQVTAMPNCHDDEPNAPLPVPSSALIFFRPRRRRR